MIRHAVLIGALLIGLSAAVDGGAQDDARAIRFATCNAALSGQTPEGLAERLATPEDAKLKQVAEIIQTVRPDVLLINEFDHDPTGQLATLFQKHYLAVAQGTAQPIVFGHAYSPPVNTGLPTGIDLDGDGNTNGPGDAHGWGDYPGQYGILLLSRFRLDTAHAVSQQEKLWAEFPFSYFPKEYYPGEARDILRLSSKTHVSVPMRVDARAFSVLISHPTPPVFDGPEDRNGKRNFDEIGLLAQIVNTADRPVVVMGDLNADPNDGESLPGAIDQLLTNAKITDPRPRSAGAVAAAESDGGVNTDHKSDAAFDTADWSDHPPRGPGNLRVDYVLPTTEWEVIEAGVFWPAPGEPGHELVNVSDHRLVWADLRLTTPRQINPRRAPFSR
ncbi:MAG: endonuclease/exonuclease/phosphatase family protein [Planctomycetota bacterium]